MTDQLIQLIYASSAYEQLSETELVEILEVSRRKNAERDITGLLLYRGGNFLQVLEGPASAVDALYQTIANDPRHKGIILIARKAITERDFPNWEMGFTNLDTLSPDDLPNYSTILDEPFDNQTFSARPSLAHHFVKVFRQNIR